MSEEYLGDHNYSQINNLRARDGADRRSFGAYITSYLTVQSGCLGAGHFGIDTAYDPDPMHGSVPL
jgi:hypothetical protein